MSSPAQGEKVLKLQTWQAILGLVAAVVGLYVYARKPASTSETAQALPQPVGPAGFGETAGFGAAGGVTPSSPARTGEQTPTAGNPGAGGGNQGVGPKLISTPKLVTVPVGEPAPGESQGEWDRKQQERARPGQRGGNGQAGLGIRVRDQPPRATDYLPVKKPSGDPARQPA